MRGPGGLGPNVAAWLGGLTVAQLVGLTGASVVLAQLALGGWFLMHLLRQNGRLLVRIEALEVRVGALDHGPVGRPVPAAPVAGLPVGSPAPAFRLPALDGKEWGLDDLRAAGRPHLLIFSDPGCGPCRALMPDVARWQRRHDKILGISVISRDAPDANQARVGKMKLRRVLLQRDREVAEAYLCHGTPGAVLINPDGRIGSPLAMGAEAIADLVAVAAGERTRPVPAAVNGRNGYGHEAPRPIPPSPPAIQVGEPAPEMKLPGLNGKEVSLTDFRGDPTVMLFWNSRCGFCARMLDDLRAWEVSPPEGAPRLLVVAAGPVEQDPALGLRSPIVEDPDFRTGRAFGAAGTPSAILIDTEGRVASVVAVGAPAVLALTGGVTAPAAAP